jgi:hypothetical protein
MKQTYCMTSDKEPTDRQLSALMHDVTINVKKKAKTAALAQRKQLKALSAAAWSAWSRRVVV